MSHIKKFELFHGLLLAKIFRNNDASLSLVETDIWRSSATHKINDAATVYVKCSNANRQTAKESKTVWAFRFTPSEKRRLQKLQQEKPVYIALVCGQTNANGYGKMQVAFLEPDEIGQCIRLDSNNTQSVTVEVKPKTKLRVYGPNNSTKRLRISRNRLDKWDIPGK